MVSIVSNHIENTMLWNQQTRIEISFLWRFVFMARKTEFKTKLVSLKVKQNKQCSEMRFLSQ